MDTSRPFSPFQLSYFFIFFFLFGVCSISLWTDVSLERAISFPVLFCVELRQTTDDSNELWRSQVDSLSSVQEKKKKKSVVVKKDVASTGTRCCVCVWLGGWVYFYLNNRK